MKGWKRNRPMPRASRAEASRVESSRYRSVEKHQWTRDLRGSRTSTEINWRMKARTWSFPPEHCTAAKIKVRDFSDQWSTYRPDRGPLWLPQTQPRQPDFCQRRSHAIQGRSHSSGVLPLPAINTTEGATENAQSGPAELNNGPFCGGKALLLVSFSDDNMGLLVLFSYLCFLLDIYWTRPSSERHYSYGNTRVSYFSWQASGVWIKIDVVEVFIGFCPFLLFSPSLSVHFLLLHMCREPAINSPYKVQRNAFGAQAALCR